MEFTFRKADKTLVKKIMTREMDFARNRVAVSAIIVVILLMLSLAMVSAIYIGDLNDRAGQILGYDPEASSETADGESIARYSSSDEETLGLNTNAAEAARKEAARDLRGERAALYIGAVAVCLLLAFAAFLASTERVRQFRNSVIFHVKGECAAKRVGFGRHGRYYITIAANGRSMELPVTGRTYSTADIGSTVYVVSADRSAWSVDGVYSAEELDNPRGGEDMLLDV